VLSLFSIIFIVIDNEVEWNNNPSSLSASISRNLQLLRMLNVICSVLGMILIYFKILYENTLYILSYANAPGNKKLNALEILYCIFEYIIVWAIIPPYINEGT
jgi:hypothetical protein